MCPTTGSGLHPASSGEQHVFICQKDFLGCSWQVICKGSTADVEIGWRRDGRETSVRRGKENYPKLEEKAKGGPCAFQCPSGAIFNNI